MVVLGGGAGEQPPSSKTSVFAPFDGGGRCQLVETRGEGLNPLHS